MYLFATQISYLKIVNQQQISIKIKKRPTTVGHYFRGLLTLI